MEMTGEQLKRYFKDENVSSAVDENGKTFFEDDIDLDMRYDIIETFIGSALSPIDYVALRIRKLGYYQ